MGIQLVTIYTCDFCHEIIAKVLTEVRYDAVITIAPPEITWKTDNPKFKNWVMCPRCISEEARE